MLLLRFGEVAEWSKAAVLKTVEPQGSVGSNPTLSARLFQWGFASRPFVLQECGADWNPRLTRDCDARSRFLVAENMAA